MDKLSRPEIIITLAMIAPLILVFIEHDEGFILFLIEIGFIAIIGLMYVGFVLTAIVITEFVKKIIWRIKNGKESGD